MGIGFFSAVNKRMKRGIVWRVATIGIYIFLFIPLIFAQQASTSKPSRLVTGKLVYVAPMPNGVDQWIQGNLTRWGKYTVTANPEGVDLLIEGKSPEEEAKLESHGGVAQPKGTGKRVPLPHHKQPEHPLISITVVDWITGQQVWQADIVNQRPKSEEADSPPGPQTRIRGRDLTPDQIATKVVARLRDYVTSLEKPAAAPAAPQTGPNKEN